MIDRRGRPRSPPRFGGERGAEQFNALLHADEARARAFGGAFADGSCWAKVIPLLTDPGAHGADPADAFDVVVPDMPGYGYSDRPAGPALDAIAVADLCHQTNPRPCEAADFERFFTEAY